MPRGQYDRTAAAARREQLRATGLPDAPIPSAPQPAPSPTPAPIQAVPFPTPSPVPVPGQVTQQDLEAFLAHEKQTGQVVGVPAPVPVATIQEAADAAIAPAPPPADPLTPAESIIARYKARQVTNLEVAYLVKREIAALMKICLECQMPQAAQNYLNFAGRSVQGRIAEKEFGFYGTGNARPVAK